MFSISWAAVGSVCLSTLVWSSSTALKEIPWLFPLPTCQFSFQGSFCMMWNRWPCRAEHCWQLPSPLQQQSSDSHQECVVQVPGWTSSQPGTGSRDKIKPILKCSLLHSAEIRAYLPRGLIIVSLSSPGIELADNMEGVWFVFLVFGLFLVVAVKNGGGKAQWYETRIGEEVFYVDTGKCMKGITRRPVK